MGPTGPAGTKVYGALAVTGGCTVDARVGIPTKIPMDLGEISLNVIYVLNGYSSIIVPEKGIYEVSWYLCGIASNNVDLVAKIGKNGLYSNQLSVQKNLTGGNEFTMIGKSFQTVNENTIFDMRVTAQDTDVLITIPSGGMNAFLSVQRIGDWT